MTHINFSDFASYAEELPETEGIKYDVAYFWIHREHLPLCALSLPENAGAAVKLPAFVVNSFGVRVPVVTIDKAFFAGRVDVTDIILPPTLESIPEGAFSGCRNLRRLTLPKKITKIEKGTLEGCTSLEDVYYEGSFDEWKQVEVVCERHETVFGALVPGSPICETVSERLVRIPGNEPLFSATIHFNCPLGEGKTPFSILHKERDVTNLFCPK